MSKTINLLPIKTNQSESKNIVSEKSITIDQLNAQCFKHPNLVKQIV